MAVPRPAERALTPLLPRAVALLACAVLGTASIAAVDQRRDRDAAAAEAFSDGLRPIAEVVFDHVQPLVEAERQREDDLNGGFSVYVDVARDATTASALRAARAALEELRVPPSLERVAGRLTRALEDLEEAAVLHAALPFEEVDGAVSLGEARAEAAGRLDRAVAAWGASLRQLHPTARPAVPVPPDEAEPVRRPVSHPAYLLRAGRACGRADATGEGQQEEPTDAASVARTAAQEAGAVRALVRGLLAVPVPAQDRPRLEREVLVPLREYGRVADVLERLAASSATSEVLFDELVGADAAGARVAAGLGDYGSRTCALLFGS